jgi:long-chain acyl-CoA synthetase
MLTETLKVKRRVVWERYQKQIEALYEGEDQKAEKRSAAAAS